LALHPVANNRKPLSSVRAEEGESFAEELPAALRDVARRGLAWLEVDGLRIRKLNSIGAAWLAQFFPPGVHC
jgi:hypothetical protein